MKGDTPPGPPFGINPRPHGGSMDNVAHRNFPRARSAPPAPSLPLSPDDRRMLEVVPGVFKGRQRRRGLVVPTYSPSGATGFRLRPNRRISPGRKYEQAAGVGSMLDVHPFNLERVKDAGTELWVTEGEKTADSLASRG